MDGRVRKTPGPDHPITISPSGRRVIVRAGDTIIADTSNALILQEASYPPVHYIPRADVGMAHLTPSTHVTYCPYKSDCVYFDMPAGGERFTNSVWSYEAPYDAVAAIKDHLAFYPDRYEIIVADD